LRGQRAIITSAGISAGSDLALQVVTDYLAKHRSRSRPSWNILRKPMSVEFAMMQPFAGDGVQALCVVMPTTRKRR
jgi:transcriptional regulator GlxA family with amidase domain